MEARPGSATLAADVLSPSQIRRNFAGYLPMLILAGAFYFLFIGFGIKYLLGRWIAPGWPTYLFLTLIGALVAGGMVAYARSMVRRVGQFRLVLDADSLIIHGQTARGLREVRFRLDDIQLVAFGQPLSLLERCLGKVEAFAPRNPVGMAIVKDLKAGQLAIIDTAGQRHLFHFVDKAFDPASLAALAAELIRRGVNVTTLG